MAVIGEVLILIAAIDGLQGGGHRAGHVEGAMRYGQG